MQPRSEEDTHAADQHHAHIQRAGEMAPGTDPGAIVPATRVMSPNLAAGQPMCAGCGRICEVKPFLDYSFCSVCYPQVVREYAAFKNAQERAAWETTVATQLAAVINKAHNEMKKDMVRDILAF